MNLKSFFQKNWQHFAAIGFIIVLAVIFYKPQMDGYDLKRHDVEQWKGMAEELVKFRNETGSQSFWTNSMFGGMPGTQISVIYGGNIFQSINRTFFSIFPSAMGLLVLHLIGFYILGLFLRLKPLVALLGAIAFSFASYEIIIVQAGHNTKAIATAYLAPLLGSFIYSYREKNIWGILFITLFFGLEMAANHLQVTYYLGFLLLALGVYFLTIAVQRKELKSFMKVSGGIVAGILFAIIINSGNILLTSDYAKHTIRGANDLTKKPSGETIESGKGGLDKAYITNWSYGIGETATFIIPDAKGGGSFPLGGSQFQSIVEDSDFKRSEQQGLMRMYAYWGEQPITSGPFYLGIVVVLLAFLGLVFMKNAMKWPMFIVALLAVMLSWGKNFMGLTDFFIDFVPGYDKFRTVTIILVIVELIVAVMGVLFLSELIKRRDALKKQHVLFAVSGFFVFLLGLKFIGLGDNYWSSRDQQQLDKIETSLRNQLETQDAKILQQNYGIDANNPQQLSEFLDLQMDRYEGDFKNLKKVRSDIFHASVNRSLILLLLSGGMIILFVYMSFSSLILTGGLLLLTMIDLIPVANDYIGDIDRFWVEKDEITYPIAAKAGDEMIMRTELKKNPALEAKINAAEKKAKTEATELELEGVSRKRFIDSYRYYALAQNTNYRVFDLNGTFGSSRASYFHKSLGGYHGAKLRNIANLIEYHISSMNVAVLDMLNVNYFLREDKNGHRAMPRNSAMGSAWLTKKVESYPTPDEEIRALGNVFTLKNIGKGSLLINGNVVTESKVYGGEKLQYVVAQGDSLDIPIRSGLREGEEAVFVMDINGAVNLVPKTTIQSDTANSFKQLVEYAVLNQFNPREEAVMLDSETKKISSKTYTGQGTIQMKSYAPNELTYEANADGKQFAVFSEIYYPGGWKAFIDGKEVDIVKTNYLLRGVEIPDGKHEIVFKFDLPAFHRSNAIAWIGSILLFLAFLFAGYLDYKRKRSANGQESASKLKSE